MHEITDESLGNTFLPLLEKYSNSGEKWEIRNDASWLAYNTIYHYNVGLSIDINDPYWIELSNTIEQTFRLVISSLMLSIFPFLQKTSFANKYDNLIDKRTKLFEQLLIRHENSVKNNSNNDNNVNSKSKPLKGTYIEAMLENEKENKIRRDEILADIFSLFAAGTDTSASTLQSGIILFGKYPNIQKKFYNICLKLWKLNGESLWIGTGTDSGSDIDNDTKYKGFRLDWIRMSDKYNKDIKILINEFKAIIYEILRISSIAPRGLSHFNIKQDEKIFVPKEYGTLDGKDHNYIIPKGSFLVSNAEYIHKYSKYETEWKHKYRDFNDINNDQFCLENWFVDGDSSQFVKNINKSLPYLAFGTGKRDCVGRYLALHQFQLFIATLVLNFQFYFKDKNDLKPQKDLQIFWDRNVTTKVKSPDRIKVCKRK